MPRPKQRMTAVERLIVLAIIGILLSIVMPNLQRAKRQHPRARPSGARVTQHGDESAGQLNTIEVTDVSRSRKQGGPAASGRAIRSLVRVALIAIAVIALVNAYRRRFLRPGPSDRRPGPQPRA